MPARRGSLGLPLLAVLACHASTGAGQAPGGTGGTGGAAQNPPAGGGMGQSLQTPCRDLDPTADHVAAGGPGAGLFLVVNELGATVVHPEDWSQRRTFAGHLGSVAAAALSADGKVAASVGSDGALRIWRTDDARELAHVDRGGLPVGVALSPTGDLAATVDDDGTVAVIGPDTRRTLWEEQRAFPHPGLLSVGAAEVVVGTGGGFGRRAARTGARLPGLESITGATGPAAVSRDQKLLAYAAGNEVRVVQLADGQVRGPGVRGGSRVTAVALSGDGALLFVGNDDGVGVYQTASGAMQRTLPTASYTVTGLAVSADDSLLAVAAARGLFFRLSDGQLLQTLGQTGFTWLVSFATDGRLALDGAGGPTQVWDVERGVRRWLLPRSLNGNQGTITFSPAGPLLINFETEATFWDVDANQPVRKFTYDTSEQPDRGGHMHFSPDGSWLVGPGPSIEPGSLRVWDAATGKLLRTWPAHAFGVTTLAVSPRGDLVASAGAEAKGPDTAHPLADLTVKLWDAGSGAAVATLTGLAGPVNSVAFSPSGDRLVTADRGGLVRLWTVPDGSAVRDLASPPAPTNSLTVNSYGKSAAFSPDGQWVAAAGVDWTLAKSPRGDVGHSGVISIWSVVDGSPKRRLVSLSEANLGWIAWSPTGKALVAGTRTGARVWCLDEGAGTPPVAR